MFNILRESKKSYSSKDIDKFVHVDFQKTGRQFTHNDTVGTVDANEQFILERARCEDFRFTLTVNPYCSNELFNISTEIVKNEGSSAQYVFDSGTSATIQQNAGIRSDKIYGKNTSVSGYDMVRNTEYSRPIFELEYHPGQDIFNNHILRNKSFRVVNYIKPGSASKDVFNTIDDYMRLANGSNIRKCNRLSIDDTNFSDKHLYDRTDILEFANGESMAANLREKDGWLGFYNNSNIPTKDKNGVMDVGRVINSKNGCEFIDMYPDRTLFSFEPKYNKFRQRTENNWDIELTYAFDQDDDFEILKSGSVNALLIAKAEYTLNQNGVPCILFRSFVKHNLKQNDSVYLYFSENEDGHIWNKTNKPYIVSSIGDIDNNNQDYYFTVTDLDLLDDVFATTRAEGYTNWDYVRDYFYKEYNGAIPADFEVADYGTAVMSSIPTALDAFVKVVENGVEKTYQLFNHDTNTDFVTAYDNGDGVSAEDFIRGIVNNAFTCDDGIDDNNRDANSVPPALWNDYITFRFAKTNGNTDCTYYVRKFKKIPNMKSVTNEQYQSTHVGIADMPFDNENYCVGYSTTIYGDPVFQYTFTDNINVSGLKTNLGCEPREFFVTIIKRNKGHELWNTDTNNGLIRDDYGEIEFSHCFGPLTCGFDLFTLKKDLNSIKTKAHELCCATMINNNGYGPGGSDAPRTIGDDFDVDGPHNITIDDEWFYGDIVEFNPNKYTETVLCDVDFRFNTLQREKGSILKYNEILTDDFDKNGFETSINSVEVVKPEGYIYKAHYPMKLRGYTGVKQGSNFRVVVANATPVQDGGVFIRIDTIIRHNLTIGDTLYLMDSTDYGRMWELKVTSVVNKNAFIMQTISRDSDDYQDWISVCNNLNNGSYVLKSKNYKIPDYAVRLRTDTYIWRDSSNAWDIDNVDEDIKEYMFTNGCLYIDEAVNFFLRRQDPEKCNSLQWYNEAKYPCAADIEGERIGVTSNYAYKEEYTAIC
jgi:hypothetical protein